MKDRLNWGLISKYRVQLYGIATLMILIFHSENFILYPGIFQPLTACLNYGVDIFLLISGICLYFSFSKDGNYCSFMKKRCERTLLPYLIIGLFFWIWRYLIAETSILDFLYNVSGLSLFLLRKDGYLAVGEPVIWYVGFILVMYAVYPLIYNSFFKVSEKKKNIRFTIMIVAAVALTLFLRAYTPATFEEAEIFLTRIPVFITGCYLGKAVKEKKKFNLFDYIFFFSFIPLRIITKIIGTDAVLTHRYLGLFAAFLVCFIFVVSAEITSNIKFISKPLKKILSFFGNLSLEIYIIHVLIYDVVLYYIPDMVESDIFTVIQKVLIYTGIIAISVIFAVIFSKGINAAKESINNKKAQKS